MAYLKNISRLGKLIFPSLIWNISTPEKIIHLSFDDGPIPEITPWVLEQLNKFQAKATFFCVGENIRNNLDIYQQIIANGHTIGNHTYNHLNGWKVSSKVYLENIQQTESLIQEIGTTRKFFRPPYGKLLPNHINRLKNSGYRIVMWDVLSGDFDRSISPETCYKNVIDNAKKGSIIVFHDNIKAWDNLKETLPRVLEYYSGRGYRFKAL